MGREERTFWHREQQVGRPDSQNRSETNKKTTEVPHVKSSENKERVIEMALGRQ